MIQGRLSKNVPPSDPFGVTTSVNAVSPNGTTSEAWRPPIGKRLMFVTSSSPARRVWPR